MVSSGRWVLALVPSCGALNGCASTATGRSSHEQLAAIGFPATFHVVDPAGAAQPGALSGAQPGALPAAPLAGDDESAHHRGFWHTTLLYIPNRVFDLLDIVRLRLRLGPGLAFDARATEAADFFIGTYASVWVGIPGPRGSAKINWPLGLESKNGAELSFLDVSSSFGAEPGYGSWEFGLGVQALIIGADVGVDPWEGFDFLAGILTIDPAGDDL